MLEQKFKELYAIRQAAERVCWFDWSSNDSDAVASIEALRRALGQGGKSGGNANSDEKYE
jgi:hypothetical protein